MPIQERSVLSGRANIFTPSILIYEFSPSLSGSVILNKAVIKDDEKAERLFLLAMFALSSSLLELVDLALDQVMRGLSDPSMYGYRISLSVMESFLGFAAILMVYYSIDRFLVFIRRL